MNASSCPSAGCREIWPLPVVSLDRTTLPAGRRLISLSLVSYSISPVSQITNFRLGELCQLTSVMPAGTRQKLIPLAGHTAESDNSGRPLKICWAAERAQALAYGSHRQRRRKYASRSSAPRLFPPVALGRGQSLLTDAAARRIVGQSKSLLRARDGGFARHPPSIFTSKRNIT